MVDNFLANNLIGQKKKSKLVYNSQLPNKVKNFRFYFEKLPAAVHEKSITIFLKPN
jgi:hypothetical protein